MRVCPTGSIAFGEVSDLKAKADARLALTFMQAHHSIRSSTSTQFDPAVVAAFMQSARRLRSMVEAEGRPLPLLLRSAG